MRIVIIIIKSGMYILYIKNLNRMEDRSSSFMQLMENERIRKKIKIYSSDFFSIEHIMFIFNI